MTSECFNLLDSKCYGGNVAIKIDITKAFDTISWGFLLKVLEAFGFHPKFVLWVKSLLQSAKLSLLIHGRPVGYFSCGRGVRQGDPLSPLLFCLAEEVLSRGLTEMVNSTKLKLISSPRNTRAPSHVLFADDVIVFCRGDKRNLDRVMHFFDEYGRASGQFINKSKSQVFISKHLHHRRHSIASTLGISLGSDSFTYLGVPIFRGKPRALYFQPIVDKIRLRFSSWMGSLLSMAGRLQLIKAIIYSMLVYSFQVYEWPVSLLRRIEVWCRNFLWSGSIDKRGVPLVSWKSCCASVDEGGLGLRQLVLLNQSLLLKRCWEIYSSSAVSCLFIRNRFWPGGLMRRSYVPSSIWPGVKKFWSVVMENAQWLIGQGTNISFWRDNFMGKPIIDFFGPHTIVDNLQGYVADYISNGSWVIPDLLHLHYPALCELIEKVPLAMDPSVEDKVIWSSATSGELTAKNAFQFLRQPFPSMSWGKCIWSKFITPRMSLLTWKVLRGRILSDDFLQRRGVALASRCGLCGRNSESLAHIFLECSYSNQIWCCMFSKFELGTVPSSLIEVWQVGLVNRSPQLKELWLACFTTVLWFIWQARNKMKHEGQGFNVALICRLIVGHVQAASRIASGYMTNSLLDLQVLKHLGVQCKPRSTPSVIEVIWFPPPLGWVKINTDGAWKQDSGRCGYGAVFRDYRGDFIGAFASNHNIPSSIAAEVMAVIKAIELAWVRDWKHVWLEVDSSLVLNFLQSPDLVPWQLRIEWGNCLYRISQMQFRSSHIFREGNRVADALANYGATSSDLTWWDLAPPFIDRHCQSDSLGMPNFRFC